MRRKKKSKKIFIFIILIFLILTIWLVIKNKPIKNPDIVSPTEEPIVEPTTYVSKIINSSNVNIKDGWQELIIKYLDLYTKSLVKLDSLDVKELFTDPNSDEAYLTQNALELIVEHHKLQDNDMKLSEAKYDIEYKDIKINNNKVTIYFLEDDYYKFNYMKDITSKVIDVENTIVINKSDEGIYTIDSIRIVKDNYVMFTNVIDFNSSNVKEKIDDLKEKYLNLSKEEVSKNRELLNIANSKEYVANKKCDNLYNRDEALEYALSYADSRNSNYADYSNVGGNCMNYASQVVFAGGIPMDEVGDYKWKYYSSEFDATSMKKGRTSSWTATKYFYEYAKYNSGYGLCSEVDVNLFYALPGDIIQVGYDGFSHTTVVVSPYKKDDKIVDILVNSNTVGLENYPVLAYPYKNKRLIKILGYNN